jgi:DNA repair photolyase
MNTIYTPKGKAAGYAPLALNIYSGCSHGCTYCYMRPMHERFHGPGSFDTPVYRAGLLEELSRNFDTDTQSLYRDKYLGETIHLCFSCDPYPAGIDTAPTREAIKLLKAAGAHVQILTKGGARAERDFDLLDGEDWFGVTITRMEIEGLEPNAAPYAERITSLYNAHKAGIKTWVSFEPVYNPWLVYETLKECDYIDLYRIGKLNYHDSPIDWGEFGRRCEEVAKQYGRNIRIKDELRAEMTAEAKEGQENV